MAAISFIRKWLANGTRDRSTLICERIPQKVSLGLFRQYVVVLISHWMADGSELPHIVYLKL